MSQPMTSPEGDSRTDVGVATSVRGEQPRSSQRLDAGSNLRSPFIPLAIFFLAAAAWSGFQFQQLHLESDALGALRANQDAQLQQAQKVRATLDAMALETQKLADAGNANAQLVVEELRKRGITINRPAAGATK